MYTKVIYDTLDIKYISQDQRISIDKWNQEYDKNLISKCHAVGYLGFNDLKNWV